MLAQFVICKLFCAHSATCSTSNNDWHRSVDAASPSAPGEDISVMEPEFDDVFNITIASNSAITAQAFNNLNAIATSTTGDATASAGDELSRVAGIESNMDISIGGLSELMAQAQGTSDSEASSISGNAEAEAWMQSVGIEDLELLISSDSDLRAISSIVGGADANSIENKVLDTLNSKVIIKKTN